MKDDEQQTTTSSRTRVDGDRTIYTLHKPVQHGDASITELRFRSVIAKDLREFPAGGARTIGDILNVIGKTCGQPAAVIDQLSTEDLQEVTELVQLF